MDKKFQPLDYSRGWDDYWRDHPEGYSPQEQMINWTGQLNAMIDFFNKYFDVDLTEYATEVMEGWYVDGRLEDIINEALFNGKADKTTVNALIDIAATHASQLAQNVDNVFYDSMVSSKAKKKLVAWIDDDGNRDFYDYFKGLYQDYGTVFNAAIAGTRIGSSTRLTAAQMQELQDLGFGFPTHGYTHDTDKRLADMTEAELHQDMKLARQTMSENGLISDVIVYGFGSHSATSREVVRQYFKAGLDTWTHESPGGYNPSPYDQFAMQRLDVHAGNTTIFPIIEQASQENEPLILMSHINQAEWPSDSDIRLLIQKLLSEGYEFVSIDTLIQQTGNIAQFGGTTISGDGVIGGNDLGKFGIEGTHINKQTIDYFRVDRITSFKVNLAGRAEYNVPVAGRIFVFRDREEYYNFRIFIGAQDNIRLYSSWNIDAQDWNEWEGGTLYDSGTTVVKNVVKNKWDSLPTILLAKQYVIQAYGDGIGTATIKKNSDGTGVANVVSNQSIITMTYDGTNWTETPIVNP